MLFLDSRTSPLQCLPESLSELEARAEAVLADLAAAHPGRRLLVVTHGGFLCSAYRRATGCSYRGRNVNAAINVLRVEAGPCQDKASAAVGSRWAVVRWGDTEHLDGGVGALGSAFGGGEAG